MKRMNEEKLNRMSDFIHRYIEEHNGVSPKFREILNYMGMSNSVCYRYLTTLRDRGEIEYSGKSSLSIKGQEAFHSDFRRIAIFGTIPCGTPDDYREELQGYVAIPDEWARGDCYLLRTVGDSMVDIGIEEGDLVLINRSETAMENQIVAVLTEEGTTLKRLKYDASGKAWLLAENITYSKSKRELHPQRIEIQGVALKVIKDLH